MPTRSKNLSRYSSIYHQAFERASLGLDLTLEFLNPTQAATWRQSFYAFRKALKASSDLEHQALFARYQYITIKTTGKQLQFRLHTSRTNPADLRMEELLSTQIDQQTLPEANITEEHRPGIEPGIDPQEDILANLGYSATLNLKPTE